MRHRNKSGQFVSSEQVHQSAEAHYKAFDDAPPHVQFLGLNYWPQLGDKLLVKEEIAAAYRGGVEMANEIARIRAFDFFWQLAIVGLGLWAVLQSDLRLANRFHDIPRDWGEVAVAGATLVGLYVKCLWRGAQLRQKHDDFVRALGLPTRDALTQD